MQRSSPGRPLTATPCFSSSALRVSYVPFSTFKARWLRSLPVVNGVSPCLLKRATPCCPACKKTCPPSSLYAVMPRISVESVFERCTSLTCSTTWSTPLVWIIPSSLDQSAEPAAETIHYSTSIRTRRAVGGARSEEAGATGPLSLGCVRNSNQSRRREPITVEVGSRGAQMKLPNYSDPLPSKQPRRDGL